MPCNDEKPCLMPILRWVHSHRCKKLTEEKKQFMQKSKMMSFSVALTLLKGGQSQTDLLADDSVVLPD